MKFCVLRSVSFTANRRHPGRRSAFLCALRWQKSWSRQTGRFREKSVDTHNSVGAAWCCRWPSCKVTIELSYFNSWLNNDGEGMLTKRMFCYICRVLLDRPYLITSIRFNWISTQNGYIKIIHFSDIKGTRYPHIYLCQGRHIPIIAHSIYKFTHFF